MPGVGIGIGVGLDGGLDSAAAALADSVALTATGAGISVSALGGDGMYTVTTDATVTVNSFVSSATDVLAGDYLLEYATVSPLEGIFAGFDNAAPIADGYLSQDECFYLGAGWGIDRAVYYKNGALTVGNILFANRLYMERVGTVEKFFHGANWAAAKAAGAIMTSTAIDGTARAFKTGINVGGGVAQWKVRAIAHPG